jgi:hypothetical protein
MTWHPSSSVGKARFVTARAISMKLGVRIPWGNTSRAFLNFRDSTYFENQTFADLTDTHTHYKTSPIALSCSSHNILSRGEHNVPGHLIYTTPLVKGMGHYVKGSKDLKCHRAILHYFDRKWHFINVFLCFVTVEFSKAK